MTSEPEVVYVWIWAEVCDLAHLTTVERLAFWGRQFMNPAVRR